MLLYSHAARRGRSLSTRSTSRQRYGHSERSGAAASLGNLDEVASLVRRCRWLIGGERKHATSSCAPTDNAGVTVYTPTPQIAARAFELGRPVGELIPVRRGDTGPWLWWWRAGAAGMRARVRTRSETWRLDTVGGSYLIKGYRSSTPEQLTDGGLLDQLGVAMAFERRALEAGVDMAEPIPPAEPSVGWIAHINGRLFRAYRWIENRGLRPDDDIADWLGHTMARIHQLEPVSRVGLPDWRRAAIQPRTTWEELFAEARRSNKSWSDLARERLPCIVDILARIEELCDVASDCVMTHGDFKPHNILMTPTGRPVLVDWDGVRVDSAILEAGQVAYLFGAAELDPISRFMTAYAAAGGDITRAGQDLFLGVAIHDLAGLYWRILVSLERAPAARWMGDSQAIEQNVGELLSELPTRIEHLGVLASKVSNING